MGFFNRKERKVSEVVRNYFELLPGYIPAFTSYHGSLYEMDLCRAAVNSFAENCSKLKIEVVGNNTTLNNILKYQPNPMQDTSKFIRRIATMLEVDNNVFIAPVLDDFGIKVQGFLPLRACNCEIVKSDLGEYWLRYRFNNNQYGAVELNRCGLLNKMQYSDDYFGSSNNALYPTLELLNMNNQGIVEGIKNGASVRFLAKLASVVKGEKLDEEREKFKQQNLSADNNGGVIVYDGKYEDVKQINSQTNLVDEKQQALINNNVFNYFGTNINIIQNKFTDDEWNAYYEGKIEPFAIQLANVLTNMTFTPKERVFGNEIRVTSNRLIGLSIDKKIAWATSFFDRGFITANMVNEAFGLPSIGEQGDICYIRGEYIPTTRQEEKGKGADDE